MSVLHLVSGFVAYCLILILITLYLIIYLAPRRGSRDLLVYITICNTVGALTVLCGKGLGIAITDLFGDGPSPAAYLHPLFWVLIAGNAIGIPVQIVFLNKSLALFNASAITPVKYVCTNLLLVIGSILLFQEFAYMSVENCIGLACGFLTVVAGVILLNNFKEQGPVYRKLGDDDYEMSSLR